MRRLPGGRNGQRAEGRVELAVAAVNQPLRLRVQLAKEGPARFLSHSEFQRALIYAARRAGLPLDYAGKHRSRVKISLSPPIPIGVTSEGEIVDFQLTGYVSPAEAQRAMNEALPEGMSVVGSRVMGVDERPVGKTIDTATYRVSLPDGDLRGSWERAVEEFMDRQSIEYERVQPRRTRSVELRPGVHRLEVAGEETAGDGSVRIEMTLDDGTRGTVKPWEVVEVLAGFAGIPRETWESARVHRTGLYSMRGDRLVSPMKVGGRKPAVSHRGGRRY